MRFLVQVDSDWKVTITNKAKENGDWKRIHAMRKIPAPNNDGYFPRPLKEDLPADLEADSLCIGDDVGPIKAIYDQIANRSIQQAGTAERFGRYLLDTLIGRAVWDEIIARAREKKARVVELALSWSHKDSSLHRLIWEMMHGREGFLAGMLSPEVAITRIVAGTENVKARQVSLPPRILFVVGTSLTDASIRPGAEALGLIRRIEEGDRSIHSRMLQRAKPSVIKDAVKQFKPDIVHFICHGFRDNEGKGYLELETDEPDQEDKRHFGKALLDCLRAGGAFPPIVVLSACYSAGGTTRLLAGYEVAPLAAELVMGLQQERVAAAVPIVVGMSGRVSDVGCRLFTRRFGEALIQGESLVTATSEARQAVFYGGQPPEKSVDWAFPAVFMAEGVEPGYTPAQVGDEDASVKLKGLIKGYDLIERPLFFGRYRFFDSYYDLLKSKIGVLGIFVKDPKPGFGRTRLLKEMAAQALRDGQVPCFISWKKSGEEPKNLLALAKVVLDAIIKARDVFDLDPPFGSQLHLLKKPLEDLTKDSNLDARIKFQIENDGEVSAKAVRLALQVDLSRLVADARGKHPAVEEAKGNAIVLLDEVHEYGEPVINALLGPMIDPHGFGTQKEPVPVVMVFSLTGPAFQILNPVTEKPPAEPWLRFERLAEFRLVDEEDVQAYEAVLLDLGQWNTSHKEVSDVPWTVSFIGRESDNYKKWTGRFRKWLQGIPGDFGNDKFYLLAEWAAEEGYLEKANDDSKLDQMRAHKKQLHGD